jgi:AhpD family alkylhydroperoxidase
MEEYIMGFKKSRKFSYFYHIKLVWKAAPAFVALRLMRKHKVLNLKWRERIMLAITEVNGCDMCSYVHTKIALQAGMSNEEIKNILGGELKDVPYEEITSVLFAKDYAFNKEVIDPSFKTKLEQQYGKPKAYAICKAAEMITMTTSMGISMKNLRDTIMFKHHKGSNVLTEVLIPLSTMVLFPLFAIISLFYVPFKVNKLVKAN